MAYVAVHIEGKEVDRIPIESEATLGRGEGCDVWIEDHKASRKHCRIFVDNGFWTVEDLASTNGTYIGRHPITRHTLRDGEIIRVGQAKIVFHAGELTDRVERPHTPGGLSGSTLMDIARPVQPEHMDRPLPSVSVENTDYAPNGESLDHSIAFTRPPPSPIVPPKSDPAAVEEKKTWWRKITGH